MLALGILLVVQNASFTLVSRARNSRSLLFHLWASVISNGIFFSSQLLMFSSIVDIARRGDVWAGLQLGAFYVACTTFGSVLMHFFSMHYIEKGKRTIG